MARSAVHRSGPDGDSLTARAHDRRKATSAAPSARGGHRKARVASTDKKHSKKTTDGKKAKTKRRYTAGRALPSEINRFHELVDIELRGNITPSEKAEMEALEQKLDRIESKAAPLPQKVLTMQDVVAMFTESLKIHGIEV